MRFPLLILLVALIASAGCSSADGPSPVDLPARPGLAAAESNTDDRTTVSRLTTAVDGTEGVSVVADIDHSRNAQSAAAGTLRPTRVLFVSAPAISSALMQSNQQAGLDLPLKVLVYEDEEDNTILAYNTADYLATRHGVDGATTIGLLAETLSGLAQAAVGAEGASLVTPASAITRGQGVLTAESDTTIGETYDRLRRAIASNPNLSIVIEINHQSEAQGAGFQLRPTRLIVFGNPDLGTPLMQASQTTGIDLPQKMLVYQTVDGRVFVAYNDPAYLAERHGIPNTVEEIAQIRTALDQLAEIATQRFARQR